MLIALFIFLTLSAISHLFGLFRCVNEGGYGEFDLFVLVFNLFMMIGGIVLAVLVVVKL